MTATAKGGVEQLPDPRVAHVTPLVLAAKPGTCRYCGCTDDDGCKELCWWIDEAETVCSGRKCVDFYFGEMRAEMKAAVAELYAEFHTPAGSGGRA